MLMPFLEMLEQTISAPDLDQTRNSDIQDMITGLLQVVHIKIGDSIDEATGEKIVQLLAQLFQQVRKVTENGLIAFSGLCQGIKERVKVDAIGQYILHALQGDDEACARVACGIVSDIAHALQEGVEKYLTSFVPQLLIVLKSDQHDRKTKLAALCSLGDLCIYAGVPYCKLYLVDTMLILESAAKITLQNQQYKNDPEMLEYFVELRQIIIECYSSLFSACGEANIHQDVMVQYSPALLSFLEQLAGSERTPVSPDC